MVWTELPGYLLVCKAFVTQVTVVTMTEMFATRLDYVVAGAMQQRLGQLPHEQEANYTASQPLMYIKTACQLLAWVFQHASLSCLLLTS